MGRPGWPELAFSTASMDRNRMVLTDFSTRETSVVWSSVSTAVARTTLVEAPLLREPAENVAALHGECDLRPENDGKESDTRSEEEP